MSSESQEKREGQDKIRVVRSDGTPQWDWMVQSSEGGFTTLIKPNGDKPGDVLRKVVSSEQFDRWQKTFEVGDRKFGVGERVNVLRSNGTLERNWKIAGIFEESGTAMVEQDSAVKNERDRLSKRVSINELAKWQENSK